MTRSDMAKTGPEKKPSGKLVVLYILVGMAALGYALVYVIYLFNKFVS
jgi:hypothetical protein